MDSELKPCPFCGKVDIEIVENEGEEWIMCDTCTSAMMNISEASIENWNTRPIEDDLRAEIERIKSAAICAYCDGVVPIGSITLHVELCDKHPISKLRAENERLNKAIEALGKYPGGWDSVFMGCYDTAQKLRIENEQLKANELLWQKAITEKEHERNRTVNKLECENQRLRVALEEIASEYGVAYERDPYEVSAWNLVVIARKALEGK